MNFIEEMLNRFLEYLQDEKRSQTIMDKYAQDVRRLLNYLGEDGVADRERVRVYKQELKECYKITSANSMLAAINSSFVLVGRGDLRVKLFKVQKILFCNPEKEMTQRGYEKLIQETREKKDVRMNMLLQTIGNTGVRISELKYITVETLDTGHTEIYNKGKLRVVLISSRPKRFLRRYYKKAGIVSGGIFAIRYGNPMDRDNINKRMKQFGKTADMALTKVFPHNLCHLLARNSYKVEKDVMCPMDLLGHSNINTTRIYTASTEDRPRRRMAKMKVVLG